MKRISIPLLSVFFAAFLCVVSCNKENGIFGANRKMTDFSFGYFQENQSGFENLMNRLFRFLIAKSDNKTFISFLSEEEIESMRSGKYKGHLSSAGFAQMQVVDSSAFMESTYEFTKFGVLSVRPFPSRGALYKVSVESLNPEIMEVLPVDVEDFDPDGMNGWSNNRDVAVRCNGLGPVDLVVTVSGLGYSLTRHYRIIVVATMDLRYTITNKIVARSNLGARIWFGHGGLPAACLDSLPLIYMRDSVITTAFCQAWYLGKNKDGGALVPLILRDTLTRPMRSSYIIPRPGMFKLLRNLGPDFRKLQGWSWVYPTAVPTPALQRRVRGEKVIQSDDGKEYMTVDHLYPYYVDQVKIVVNMVSDNPYIRFNNKSFSFLSQSTSEYEHEGFGASADSTAIESDNFDDHIEKSDVTYFVVELTDNLTVRERDSISRDVRNFKKSSGLERMLIGDSSEQADSLIARTNREMDEENKNKDRR